MNRYQITEAARHEIAETFGEAFAISILVEVDRSRSCRFFAPLGRENMDRVPLFDDQVEEAP